LDLVFQVFSPEPAWAAGCLRQHFQALGNPGLKSETWGTLISFESDLGHPPLREAQGIQTYGNLEGKHA